MTHELNHAEIPTLRMHVHYYLTTCCLSKIITMCVWISYYLCVGILSTASLSDEAITVKLLWYKRFCCWLHRPHITYQKQQNSRVSDCETKHIKNYQHEGNSSYSGWTMWQPNWCQILGGNI